MASRGACVVPTRYRSMYTDYVNSCGEHVLRLKDIWENCGYKVENVDRRMQRVFRWFNERWQTIIEDELAELEAKKEKLQSSLVELSGLFKSLDVPVPARPDDLNLEQQLDWVEHCSAQVEQISNERKARLNDLREQECAVLELMSDQQAFYMVGDDIAKTNGTVPTEPELLKLSAHISSLRRERQVRLDRLRPLIQEARGLMDRMGKVPTLAIEESVQCLPPDQWDLSNANIELADNMVYELRAEEAKVHARHSSLLGHLQQMFDRLDVLPTQREQILGDLVATKTYQAISRLEELEDEYRSLVQANMARYIEKLRNEASKCYEELRTGKDWQEPSELKQLLDEGRSEQALEAYEKVIEDLKTKRSLVMPLFKLLDELKQLKETAKQLEESQKDPQRFKNRGGALLQETKRRERVNKNMPLVVNQIMKFLDAHEPVHGPIFVFGKTVREVLNFEQQSSVKLRSNNSTNSSSVQSPSKPVKSGLATPSNATRLYTGGQRGSTLKRAGTYTQLKTIKSKLGDSVQQRERTKPLTNAGGRNQTTKSPDNSHSKANATSTKKGTLRRSLSYDDFEGKLCTNDLQSTRIGHAEVFSQASNRRLFF